MRSHLVGQKMGSHCGRAMALVQLTQGRIQYIVDVVQNLHTLYAHSKVVNADAIDSEPGTGHWPN